MFAETIFVPWVASGLSYKTRLDEDDGFGQLIPLCREFSLSRVNPQSRAFAAILVETIIGPVIDVQIVKILDQYGLEIATPSLLWWRTDILCHDFQRQESVFGCNFTFPVPHSDLVQNYSLNFRNQKEGDLAWDGPIEATRKLVHPCFKSN